MILPASEVPRNSPSGKTPSVRPFPECCRCCKESLKRRRESVLACSRAKRARRQLFRNRGRSSGSQRFQEKKFPRHVHYYAANANSDAALHAPLDALGAAKACRSAFRARHESFFPSIAQFNTADGTFLPCLWHQIECVRRRMADGIVVFSSSSKGQHAQH